MTNIVVHKIPSDAPQVDRPPVFPDIENHHLDLLEEEAKRKPGLALIPLDKKMRRVYPIATHDDDDESTDGDDDGDDGCSGSLSYTDESKDSGDDHTTTDSDDDDLGMFMSDDGGSDGRPGCRNVVGSVSGERSSTSSSSGRRPPPRPQTERYTPVIDTGEDAAEAKEDEPDIETLISRFDTLRRYNPECPIEIPVVDKFSDVVEARASYRRITREIKITNAVKRYKRFLFIGFLAIEYGCGWLGVDMSGYAKHQLKEMHDYEVMLVELGEKHQASWFGSMPVELRLVGLVLFQAVVYFLVKTLTRSSPGLSNVVMSLISGGGGAPGPTRATGSVPAPKPKMKGPSISIRDLKN